MSRRGKSRSGGGNIKFVGLRYFLAASEGRVSRNELIELIRKFFTSRGLALPDNLRVEFRMTRRPTSVVGDRRTPIGGFSRYWEHTVVVYVYGRSFAGILRTLHHELDHEAWGLSGNRFDFSSPYRVQPHEVRAFANEGRWDRLAAGPAA